MLSAQITDSDREIAASLFRSLGMKSPPNEDSSFPTSDRGRLTVSKAGVPNPTLQDSALPAFCAALPDFHSLTNQVACQRQDQGFSDLRFRLCRRNDPAGEGLSSGFTEVRQPWAFSARRSGGEWQ